MVPAMTISVECARCHRRTSASHEAMWAAGWDAPVFLRQADGSFLPDAVLSGLRAPLVPATLLPVAVQATDADVEAVYQTVLHALATAEA